MSNGELRDWLGAIGVLTAAVNAGRDLRSVLDLGAATGRELLGLDFCGVLVPDATGQNLVIAGWSGLTEEYVARVNSDRPVRLAADASEGAPSSRAYRSGLPCAVADIAVEPDFIWGGVAREQGYRSMVSVPLVTADGVIGTLNGYRATAGAFTAGEVDRMALLADHAALAITAARTRDDLRRQHELGVHSAQIHERLLRVAVRSGGVAGIASAVADLLGSPVLVEDAYGEVLATAGGPGPSDADRAVAPTGAAPERAVRTPRGTDPALVLEHQDHLVVDVTLDGEVGARLWVTGRAGAVEPLDRRALENASIVLSLELLRRRTAVEVEQNLRGDLLADLLRGADPRSAGPRERARLLGHDLDRPHRVLVAVVDGAPAAGAGPAAPIGTGSAARTLSRAVTAATRLAATVTPRPLVAAYRDAVVALWPVPATGPAAGRPAADALRRALLAAPGIDIATVAVSSFDPVTPDAGAPDPGRSDLGQDYRAGRGALALAGPSGATITLDDLGVAGLLLQLDDAGRLRVFADRTLGALRRHDQQRDTELLRTLRVHLDSGLDRRRTGRALTVHPNTVSQRLRRIGALTGLDLGAPRDVVDARAALVLLDVADGVESA